MVLDFEGVKNTIFKTSSARNIGIDGEKESEAIQQKDRELLVSIKGTTFIAENPTSDLWSYEVSDGNFLCGNNTINIVAHINFPDGVEIISGIAQGLDNNNVWTVYRNQFSSTSGEAILTEDLNSEDTAPAAGTEIVDNDAYGYYIKITGVGNNDKIYGMKLKYKFID